MSIREKITIVIFEVIIILIAARIGFLAGNKIVSVEKCLFIEKNGAIVGPVYLLWISN